MAPVSGGRPIPAWPARFASYAAAALRGENTPVAARKAMLAGRVALAAAVAATILAVIAFG